jgi:spoIIIJ-associated protein
MSQQKREFEAHAESVDEAITIGLAALDLKKDEVTIKVLDEGSRGLLGIGSRNAVVRLTAVHAPTPEPVAVPIAPKPKPVVVEVVEIEEVVEEEEETAVYEELVVAEPIATAADDADESTVAREVVANLLQKMGMDAAVTIQESEVDGKTGRVTPIIDVRGENLNALIGSRGETMAAIQYIARLIVANRRHERAHFVIDIDGYRQKREKALARLAERMATKVIDRQEAISLEPMPPADRRIVHITLRDMDGVYTESMGEGSGRKVRILPAE